MKAEQEKQIDEEIVCRYDIGADLWSYSPINWEEVKEVLEKVRGNNEY